MTLKPFVINDTDIQFILDQVNFVPLFDSQGNIIVNWDGTGTVYNFSGQPLRQSGKRSLRNLAKWGSSYQNYTDLAGTRDVSGFWNNLAPLLAHYGDTGQIFPRMAAADYGNYLSAGPGRYLKGLSADCRRSGTANAVTATDVTFSDSIHYPGHGRSSPTTPKSCPYPVPHTLTVHVSRRWHRTTTLNRDHDHYSSTGTIIYRQSLRRTKRPLRRRTKLTSWSTTAPASMSPSAGAFVSGHDARSPVTISGGELDGSITTSRPNMRWRIRTTPLNCD